MLKYFPLKSNLDYGGIYTGDMKILLLTAFAFLLGLPSVKAAPIETVVDYLRTTPANVTGNLRVAAPMELYSSGFTGVRIIPSKIMDDDINFAFSEAHLQLRSSKAMRVVIGGISFTIRELSYDRRSGKFKVRVNTPLGIGAGLINQKIQATLEKSYKPKLERAFAQLSSMRTQRSLGDANNVLQSILGIFTEGQEGKHMPTVTGNISLNFNPPQNKRLGLELLRADIHAGDQISAAVDFVYQNKNFVINNLNFTSNQGIRITPGNTSIPEFANILLRGMNIGRNGVQMEYDIGAEEMIAGFTVLIQMIDAYTTGPGRSCRDCVTRLNQIRQGLDGRLQQEIAKVIRSYRPQLLAAGANPRLLNALD